MAQLLDDPEFVENAEKALKQFAEFMVWVEKDRKGGQKNLFPWDPALVQAEVLATSLRALLNERAFS